MATSALTFSRPWWLLNGHLETLWSRKLGHRPTYQRRLAQTIDDDPVAFDWLEGNPTTPVLCIFHGLEGCSQSHSVRQLASYFNHQGWQVVVPHFRSCGIMNKLPRAYHAGDSTDLGWMVKYVSAWIEQPRPLFAIGLSLGGNVLAKWLAENSGQQLVSAAATVCAPFDLSASIKKIEKTFNHFLYERYFLSSLRNKLEIKLKKYPFLVTKKQLESINSIRQFDDFYTAPIHGFAGVNDYYERASALPQLPSINTSTLCIYADNDAIVDPPAQPANAAVSIECCKKGGHIGFVSGSFPGKADWLAKRLESFFLSHL